MDTDPIKLVVDAIQADYALFRHPRYGTELTGGEIEMILADGLERSSYALVPRRWALEVTVALKAATTIGMRSCRDGDHLHYSNHDRLVSEARSFGVTTDEAGV